MMIVSENTRWTFAAIVVAAVIIGLILWHRRKKSTAVKKLQRIRKQTISYARTGKRKRLSGSKR